MNRRQHSVLKQTKPTLLVVLVLLFTVGRSSGQAPSLQDLSGKLPGDVSTATTIYVAKEFITIDPKKPKAGAIAVVNGKFAAVGTLAEVQAAVGKDVRIDKTFEGKIVSAGFIEPHVHPLLAAVTMSTKVISIEDWDAMDGFSPAVRDPKGYEQRLNEALEARIARGPTRTNCSSPGATTITCTAMRCPAHC